MTAYRRKPIKRVVYRKLRPKMRGPLKKIQKDVNRLKASDETKYLDKNGTNIQLALGSNFSTVLNNPAQGDAVNQRDGDEIQPYRINICGTINRSSLQTAPDTVRVMLIQSKQRFVPATNTVDTTSTSVLMNQTNSRVPISHFNWRNRKHFTVLYDKVFTLSGRVSSGNTPRIHFEINKKLTKKVFFEVGTTNFETGRLSLLFYTTHGTDGPFVDWESRMLFKG